MMTEITIPIWLLALSAGVPCFSFICLLLFILRKIRKPNKELFIQMQAEPKGDVQPQRHQFHHDLMALQIDAVFNSLNAIIETERVKLNTLLCNATSLAKDRVHPVQHPQARQLFHPTEQACEAPASLEDKIATIATAGGQPGEIADEMGLSQAEVELALQMRSSRATMGHKLEAVA